MQKEVYLSLGSNLGDRIQHLEKAIGLLQDSDFIVVRRSSMYETEPRDFPNQPWFLNMVVKADAQLFPRKLLARIGRIEAELGRRRTVQRGPRTIDIDILLFGKSIIESADLVIPHPRMLERRFVLEPLLEISPDITHPVTGRALREAISAVTVQNVRRLIET